MLKNIFKFKNKQDLDGDSSQIEPNQQEDTTKLENPEKGKIFKKFKEKLLKTRENLIKQLDNIFLGEREIDSQVLEEIEEILIMSDIGVGTVEDILSTIKDKLKRKELANFDALISAIKAEILSLLKKSQTQPKWEILEGKPYIILVVGVNGVGKTTSIAKLGNYFKNIGKKVMFVAADTFRAAAIEQLETWAKRLDIPIIKHSSGADPSSVVFDSIDAAIKREVDVLIIDTAGRLHTKVNLMEELKKIKRTISKKIPHAPHDTFIVLDATTGQNGLLQVSAFNSAVNLSGIILTKLDSTAKGGIVISIINETNLPVRFIGVGEGVDDFQPFDPEEFVEAIIDK